MAREYVVADFETTTDPDDCRVWAWAICDLKTLTKVHGTDIDSFIELVSDPMFDYNVFFHNLKFDGDFLINWLFKNGFKYVESQDELSDKTFTTLIATNGQFFTMDIMFQNRGKFKNSVHIQDSLKILPIPVREIAKAFNLPILKGEIDYDAYRPVGYKPDKNEWNYIDNDVEIVARGIKEFFALKLKKMTLSADALFSYKKSIGGARMFNRYFPQLDYDNHIRASYKGGYVYVKEDKKGVDIGEGLVFDVNSLYPSVMYSELLPYYEGIYFEGDFVPTKKYPLAIMNIDICFDIKPDHLPTIQIKKGYLQFNPTEYQKSSNGDIINMTVTSVDLDLIKQQYDLSYLQVNNGYKFMGRRGLFKDYIDHWTEVKIRAGKEGNKALRFIAKRMLNSLYGKFGTNPNATCKIPYLTDDGVRFYRGEEKAKPPVYLPMASFVTAYARRKTITTAQKLYDRFIYSDTDSIHITGTEIPEGIEIDDYKLGAWALESKFTRARFLRQKCYIEEIDGELSVTVAGMPVQCHSAVTFDNFKIGSRYQGKLVPQRVDGGIVLKDTEFTIKM